MAALVYWFVVMETEEECHVWNVGPLQFSTMHLSPYSHMAKTLKNICQIWNYSIYKSKDRVFTVYNQYMIELYTESLWGAPDISSDGHCSTICHSLLWSITATSRHSICIVTSILKRVLLSSLPKLNYSRNKMFYCSFNKI